MDAVKAEVELELKQYGRLLTPTDLEQMQANHADFQGPKPVA